MNMASFPRLSGKFLDDSSIERIVIGKYSSKSLVTLEMLEKSGDVQPENNERLGGEVKDVFQSQRAFGGEYLFFKVSQNQPMDRSHGSETSAKIIMMTITAPNRPELCSRHYAESFICMISYNAWNNPVKQVLLSFPHCRLEN